MIPDINWDDIWKESQASKRRADDVEFWNERAYSFAQKAGTSRYSETFLDLCSIEDGETVFDMGCGPGTLAIQLAQKGHRIVAADFSPNMLSILIDNARDAGVEELIDPVELSWAEPWETRDLPVCDVALASRSIATDNLRDAFVKINSCARRRVCLTLSTGSSPRSDEVLLRAVGRPPERYPDYVIGMNLLWAMGMRPELSYIDSKRDTVFASFDEAIEKTCAIIGADEVERDRLVEYSREHLREHRDESGEMTWVYDHTRVTSWAFIAWNK